MKLQQETFTEQEQITSVDAFEERIGGFLTEMDDRNIQILMNFYFTGQSFPSDTQAYNFIMLVRHLGASGVRVGKEAIRKRLKTLVQCGFLVKWGDCNPTIYNPIRDDYKINVIRDKLRMEIKKRKIFALKDHL